MGVELHWEKFQLIQTDGDIQFLAPSGHPIPATEQMKYLGATIYSSGNMKQELVKRLGGAWGEFQMYTRAWKHTSINLERKLNVFGALVTTKVMYSLSSAWLNKSDRRRLDGFQARCLRHILNIPHSYISRVSNKSVLQQAGATSYSGQLLQHQLMWFGKLGRSSDADVLRKLTFQPGSVRPITDTLARKRGRPRHEWAKCLYNKIRSRFESDSALSQCAADTRQWCRFVTQFVEEHE